MKRNLLIVATLLALCFASLLVVGAGAETGGAAAPSLSIDYVNLSFSDSVYIKYAVAAENAVDDDVRLLVWRAPSETGYAYGTQAETVLPAYLDTIGGKQYIIFDYKNIAAKEIGDDIYVRACVTVGDQVYLSDMNKYSVLRYAYNNINKSGTKASLKALLSGMLEYATAAQNHFSYKTGRPINGTWYSITVENGSLADGSASGLYRTGDQITLVAAEAPAGQKFSHWQDATGANISTEETYQTAASATTTYTAVFVDQDDSGEAAVNKLAYSINADGTSCTITGLGTCLGPEIIIPAEIDGYTVTAIGDKAFAEQPTLTKITIPETVKAIGTRAFYASTGLTEMTIPASVTEIGTQIFYKCDNLKTVYYNSTYSSSSNPFLNVANIEKVVFGGKYVPAVCRGNANIKTVEIKQGVIKIDSDAFQNCTSLTNITIGNSVTSIGRYAFYGCTSLSSINIPDSVTSIDDSAFENCTSLASITIPDSVTSIDLFAFSGCTSLKAVYIADMESWLTCNFVSGANPLCNGANLYLNNVLVTEVVVPNTVTSIGNFAFEGCTSLQSINIPDSVTSIGSYAFEGCTSLSSINIPDSITSIGNFAFKGCTSLQSINIPDSVTSIDERVFCGCTSLQSITIPDSVTSIGGSAFEGCTSLSSINIPDSITSIGWSAFEGCTGLTSITIPDSVTSIGQEAFYGCTSLQSINIPDSVTSIDERVFCGCTSLTNINIGNSVTSIGRYAFSGCTSLASITIPDSVTSIGDDAFSGCTNLKNVTFVTPAGWWHTASSSATSGTAIAEADLANTETAARYLTSTYRSQYWHRD